MDLDILDLVFRLERRFGVTLSRPQLDKMLRANDPPDIRVGDLFEYVRTRANPPSVFDHELDGESLWPMFQREVSGALGVEEHEVTKDKWLLRDLEPG